MREGTCKHFTGYQNGTCKAGVNYRELVGGPDLGWAARLPCIKDSPLKKGEPAQCSLREEPMPSEILAWKLETKARSEKIKEAIHYIRADGRKSGVIECPKCDRKCLSFSVASNGHIWGECETEGCLSWIM